MPRLFYALTICFSVLGTIGVLCIKRNPDFIAKEAEITANQLSVKEALSCRQFYYIFAMDFLTLAPGLYISGNFKVMGLQLGNIDDLTLTIIGSVGSIANGGSRVIMGPL